MNVSSLNSTSPGSRSFAAAVYKNVIVTVLCITINYINGTLIHTFRKHQVCVCLCVHMSIHNALVFLLPRRHADIRFALYVFVQIIPRFVSPIVYGLRDQNFRKYMRRYLLCRVIMRKNHLENNAVSDMKPAVS
ncbi:Odorant receptor 131-2 [Dissostichus eleginoides]|uniref:Odorant receptor 131-2 n=1 Tax=Dissostichus eleginoides TaxID=100907 RepID=A0AAD9CI49_DISEL|nr:Odorant receptor 131-2 [Dissostichus eleginoides]